MSAQQDAHSAHTHKEHFYDVLETEQVNPATADIDRMSPLQIVQVMNAEDTKIEG